MAGLPHDSPTVRVTLQNWHSRELSVKFVFSLLEAHELNMLNPSARDFVIKVISEKVAAEIVKLFAMEEPK